MTRCDGRVRAGVFDLDARLAKVRSPRPILTPFFRILILAPQRLRFSTFPLLPDAPRALAYPTNPASPVHLSVCPR